jgi:hypothetical protein
MNEIFTKDNIYMAKDAKYDKKKRNIISKYITIPKRGIIILLLYLFNSDTKFHSNDEQINKIVSELSGATIDKTGINVTYYQNDFDKEYEIGDILIINPSTLPDKIVKFNKCDILYIPWCNYFAMRVASLSKTEWSLFELYKVMQEHEFLKGTWNFVNITTDDGEPNYYPNLLNDYDSTYEAFVLNKKNLPYETSDKITNLLGDLELHVLRKNKVLINPFAVKQSVVAHKNEMNPKKVLDEIQYYLKYVQLDTIPIKLNDIQYEIPYTTTESLINPYNIHIGQRKLLITELYFLNNIEYNTKDVLFVYAGAAPGYHVNFISKYIPDMPMILIDSADFYVKNSKYIKSVNDINLKKDKVKIYIYQGLMSIELAKDLSKFKNIVFLSDIRTSYLQDRIYGGPSDADILINNAQQMVWIDIIKPLKYFIKFRLPFYFDKSYARKQIEVMQYPENKPYIDYCISKFNVNYENMLISRTFSSFDGEIITQPWTKTTSTETRLMGSSTEIVDYNKSYRNRLFYYNNVLRLLDYDNIEPTFKKDPFTCKCGDCCYEYHVLKEFIKKFKIKKSIHELQIEINKYMGPEIRTLKQGGHPLTPINNY